MDIVSRVQSTCPFQCIVLCDLVTRAVCVECSGNCLLISSQKPTAASKFCTTLFLDQRCTTTSLYVQFALNLTTFHPTLSTPLFKFVRFTKSPRHLAIASLNHNTEICNAILSKPLFRSKPWSHSTFVFLKAVSTAVRAVRPLSALLCDRPCRSNFGTPADDQLVLCLPEGSSRLCFAARPRHSQNRRFLPSSASKPTCRGIVCRVLASQERQVAASIVQFRRAVGSNVRSNVQTHRRQGDNNRIVEGGNRRVLATHSMLKEMLHCWNLFHNNG